MVKRIPKNAWLETWPDGKTYWVWERPIPSDRAFLKMVASYLHKYRSKCGAKTKHHGGRPCQAKVIPGKTRCKWHGGMSTGPRTPEGRERCRQAVLKRWAKWRAQQA